MPAGPSALHGRRRYPDARRADYRAWGSKRRPSRLQRLSAERLAGLPHLVAVHAAPALANRSGDSGVMARASARSLAGARTAGAEPLWWSVDQARRWIIRGDAAQPIRLEHIEYELTQREEGPGWEVRWTPLAAEDRVAARAEAETAAAALQHAIANERVAARGIREPGADPEPIPPATMANPVVCFLAGNCIGPNHKSAGEGWMKVQLPLFRDVQVLRAAVVELWPVRTPKLAEAVAWLQANGPHVKYESALAALIKATSCTARISKDAWKAAGFTRPRGRRPSA